MKKLLSGLWEKMNEPKTSRKLMILFPLIALIDVVLILYPRLLYFVNNPVNDNPADDIPLTGIMTTDTLIDRALTQNQTLSQLPILQSLKEVQYDHYEVFLENRTDPLSGLYKIGGKVYYFDENGRKAEKIGIDVSDYDGNIMWNELKAQGIDFAILRVGGRGWESGKIYEDDHFKRNIQEAASAGIQIGVYFYSTAVNASEAIDEAYYVMKKLNGASLDYPVFIDVEKSGDYPHGRSDTIDKATRALVIDSFCKTIEHNGYKAGVYSGAYFYKNNMSYANASKYTVWIASYSRSNRLPTFDERYDMWQFTDSGIVFGILDPVDINVIF